MSDFFDSDIVKQSMRELGEMQMELFNQSLVLYELSREERLDHIRLMKNFLEKQQNLFFRMSLSDDPEAIETKEKILESARLFGLIEGQSVDTFFNSLNDSIEKLAKLLDF